MQNAGQQAALSPVEVPLRARWQDRMETDKVDESLRRAKAGDRSAFAELVHQHESMVFSLGLHYLRNREAAEEMAQEVFLSLYENLQSIQSQAHLTFWLRRVASNRCIDFSRREKKRAAVGIEDVAEPSVAASVTDPFLSEALRKLTATLPDRPRMILTLRYQEDLEPTEIARVMEIPVNTVKSHLHRALILLREKLERVRAR
ncbi:MAG TPA: RNA polymerase sigma factor [Bryobacteraceae bacterium]|nr:RNA polymerase sigma factor [Bryobacteraceae bacterium]